MPLHPSLTSAAPQTLSVPSYSTPPPWSTRIQRFKIQTRGDKKRSASFSSPPLSASAVLVCHPVGHSSKDIVEPPPNAHQLHSSPSKSNFLASLSHTFPPLIPSHLWEDYSPFLQSRKLPLLLAYINLDIQIHQNYYLNKINRNLKNLENLFSLYKARLWGTILMWIQKSN